MMDMDEPPSNIAIYFTHIGITNLATATMIVKRGLTSLPIAFITVYRNLNRSSFNELRF